MAEIVRIGDVMDAALRQLATRKIKPIEPSEEDLTRIAQALIACGYMPFDKDAFTAICKWIVNDPKGLILSGNAGTGKTMLCQVMATDKFLHMTNKYNPWIFKKAQDFVAEWMDSSGIMDRGYWYRLLKVYESETWKAELVIDDLGQEAMGVCYGMREEVMEHVICERYRNWQEKGVKTIITTNLSLDDLDKRYGRRITDRISEMCAVVEFKGESNRGVMVA